GRREVAGIVWRDAPPTERVAIALKAVAQSLDAVPPLTPQWMALVEFAAGYYQRSLGELALGALPSELRRLDAARLALRVKRATRAPADDDRCRPSIAPALTDEQLQAIAAIAH